MPQILTRVRVGAHAMRRQRPRARSAAARSARRSPRRRDRGRRRRTSARARVRSRAASSSAIHAGGCLARADVDQRTRRCCAPCDGGRRWRRSRSARTVAVPRRRATRVSVFTGDFAWHSAARNAREVVRAEQGAPRPPASRRRRAADGTSRRGRRAARAARRGSAAGTCSAAPSPRSAHGNPAATGCAHSTATAAGRCALTPRTHADRGRVGVGVEVHDLRHGVHAGVGASRGGDADRVAGDLRRCARSSASCTPQRDGCDWKPQNASPAYSRPSAMRMAVRIGSEWQKTKGLRRAAASDATRRPWLP